MERVLVVSNANELVRMKPERIAYISSDGNYVTVVLHNRTEHVFAFNLLRMQKLVETQLGEAAACFIRIGKSLIINRNYIYKINLTRQELVLADMDLDGTFRLSASREALRQLKELLEKEAGLWRNMKKTKYRYWDRRPVAKDPCGTGGFGESSYCCW